MKHTFHLCSLAAMTLGLAACSNTADEIITPVEPGTPESTAADAMNFNVQVNGNASIDTRAVSKSQYPNNTKLYIGINSNDAAIDAAMAGKRNATLTISDTGADQVVTSDPVLYWNDMGGGKADVNVWGVYLAEQNVTVSETGALDWKVATDQTAGVLPYDLHWSNNATHNKYKNVVDMEFQHAMSKITMILTVGEGFTASDAAGTVMTYLDNFTQTHVEAATRELSQVTGKSDIKPSVVSPFNGGMTATYAAIVVPTRKIAEGDALATVVVSGNTYTVRSKEDRTFESGKNYIYNVSVKKGGVAFVAPQIVDWEAVEGDADAKIIFTADANGSGDSSNPDNSLKNSASQFDIYTSNDDQHYGNVVDGQTQSESTAHWVEATGTPGSDDYVPGHWENDTPLYWDNNGDATYFRGMANTGDDTTTDDKGNFNLTAGENDVLWGTSGEAAIDPTTGHVAMQFQHIMAKIVITVVTTDGDDAVDLSQIQEQLIKNIATTASFNVGTGKYADFTAANYGDFTLKLEEIPGTNQKKYTYEFYAFPQTLNDDAMVDITVGEAPLDNTYHKQLNTILANGTAVDKWEAGKRYVYTIRLRKDAKTFAAMITDWEDVIAEEAEAEL